MQKDEAFGTTGITYTAVTAGVYDPSTGVAATVEVTTTINAVVLPTGGGKVAAFDEMQRKQGQLDAKARRFLIIPASFLSVPPKAGDRITLDGEEWTVAGSTPVNPGGTAIIYKVGINQ